MPHINSEKKIVETYKKQKKDLWIAIVVMDFLIIGYFIGQSLSKEYMMCIEAGHMTGVSAEDLRHKSFFATRAELQDHGKTVSTRKMIRIEVNGGCMKLRNIEEGTQLCVEKKAKDADLKGKISKGDILMLYLPDIKKYKIREFKAFTPEGAMSTFYYNADGTEHPS